MKFSINSVIEAPSHVTENPHQEHIMCLSDIVQDSIWNKSSVWLDYTEFRTRLNQFECSKNMKTVYPDENNVVLDENSVEWKPCINRESKGLDIKIKLYSCHDINMGFLVVVTPPSIYHGCSTWKTLWEEKFTGKEDFFLYVNINILWSLQS